MAERSLSDGRARSGQRKSRLVIRVYVYNLIAFGLIAVVLSAVRFCAPMPPPEQTRIGHYLGQKLVQLARTDRAAAEQEAQRALTSLNMELTLYEPDGTMLLTNVQPPLQVLPPDVRARLELEGAVALPPSAFAVAVREQDRLVAYGLFIWRSEGLLGRTGFAVVLALIGLALASLLFARSLLRPITQLSRTAHALGTGDLSARTKIERPDEIGDLARVLDRMAERLAELLRAQKELLANVSHELRTPLSRIRVALDIAAEGDAEQARSSMMDMEEDLEELSSLVEDILTTARLDLAQEQAGEALPIRKKQVEPAALIERAVERFEKGQNARKVEVAFNDLDQINVDPTLFRRVLDNLLDNAGKYSEADDPIRLSASKEEGGLRVVIEDQGCGMSEEDLKQLFTPFFRAERSRTRAAGGVGLGLSLAKRIIEAHGGTLAITSVLDRGTKASLWCPSGDRQNA